MLPLYCLNIVTCAQLIPTTKMVTAGQVMVMVYRAGSWRPQTCSGRSLDLWRIIHFFLFLFSLTPPRVSFPKLLVCRQDCLFKLVDNGALRLRASISWFPNFLNTHSKIMDDGLWGHFVGNPGHVIPHTIIPCGIPVGCKLPGILVSVECRTPYW